MQPEKHLPFGRGGGGNGRIQCVHHGCEELEMLYQHLGKILAQRSAGQAARC